MDRHRHVVMVDRTTGISRHHCEHHWWITSQTDGAFSGEFRSIESGPLDGPTCVHEGTFNGVFTEGGTLTELRFSGTLGGTRCTRVAGDGMFIGVVSDGSSLRAQMSDRLVCPSGGTPTDRDRSWNVAINRR